MRRVQWGTSPAAVVHCAAPPNRCDVRHLATGSTNAPEAFVHVDPATAVLGPPFDLGGAQVFLHGEGWGLHLVGMENEAAEAAGSGLTFGERRQSASEPTALSRRVHGDVLDQMCSFRPAAENDETSDRTSDDPDLQLLDCLRVVALQRRRWSIRTRQRPLVRSGHALLDFGLIPQRGRAGRFVAHRRGLPLTPDWLREPTCPTYLACASPRRTRFSFRGVDGTRGAPRARSGQVAPERHVLSPRRARRQAMVSPPVASPDRSRRTGAPVLRARGRTASSPRAPRSARSAG